MSQPQPPLTEDLRNCDCYFTHFNGSRPFCVYVNNITNEVCVYKKCKDEYISTYTDFVASFNPEKVFIGESHFNEITEFSGGHGPMFDGNSILLKLSTHQYVFIGDMIFSFRSKSEIVTFVSPVGNNDVPYPYAMDGEKNYYFLKGLNGGILREISSGDPYDYYYAVLGHIGESENIECIYIGEDMFHITSSANPEEEYESLIERHGRPLYIKFKGEDERIISNSEYVQILYNYNQKVGLEPLGELKIIAKRDI